jgi:hypothetical protein
MVRPVLQTQQAGGEVGAAHAWHAMRSGHPMSSESSDRGDERPPGSVRRLCSASISMPVPGIYRHTADGAVMICSPIGLP